MRCAIGKKCNMAEVKECTRQVGELCKNADECCSRACVKDSNGVNRCSPLACRSACELCNRDSDCCSGTCGTDPDGLRRCVRGACSLEGEVCDGPASCCQTEFAQVCVEDFLALKVKHCRRDSETLDCFGAEERCSSYSLCCEGYCTQNDSFEYRCASYCRADGQYCSKPNDCCGPYSDCISVAGERICANLGPP